MEDVTIYHNPRCSKSRETLSLLQDKGVNVTIIDYLKENLNRETILGIINKLDVPASKLVRTKESEFTPASINLDQIESIADGIMLHPKLMERPVVVRGDKAVLGRPPENIEKLF